jgi:hypothetical protein
MNKQRIEKHLERLNKAKTTQLNKALRESLEQKLQALEGKTVNK